MQEVKVGENGHTCSTFTHSIDINRFNFYATSLLQEWTAEVINTLYILFKLLT